MESTHFRGTANDFSYLVGMALQNRMPWNILALNFNTLAPTFNETRKIISILSNELEKLHSTLNEKEKMLEEYRNSNDSIEETKTSVQENDCFEETESIYEHDPLADTKLIEDSIEVPEGLKELSFISDEWNEIDQENKDEYDSEKEVGNSGEEIDDELFENLTNKEECDSETERPEKDEERQEVPSTQVIKRPFQCIFCGKSFRDTGNLKCHERIHTGEVPFECETCKKTFKSKSELNQHERIHSGEMPYECKTCNKRFNQPTNLKAHERVHSGEVPYACETCKKRFKQMMHLTRHQHIHLRTN